MDDQLLLIDGVFAPAASAQTIDCIDPSDGTVFCRIARGGAEDIDRAVAAARRAFQNRSAGGWGRLTAVERGRLMQRLARLILSDAETLARLEARDVGKPLAQARADALACARYFEFYGGAADKLHGDTIPYQDGYTVLTLREPYGVTAHIVPWNYPMQIIGRSVGAALAAGNACVIKPGEDASLTALHLGRLALKAGFPKGVINIVTGYGTEAGTALTAHGDVNYISFTGSQAVGTLVQAAAAIHTVPVTLELGGKSPQLVFTDADLNGALDFVVRGAVQNAGQTCSAGSRLLIQRPVYEQFTAMVAARFKALQVGPAMLNPDVGPLINARQRDRVQAMIRDAAAAGFPILAQGHIADHAPDGGFYLAPTLFGDVPAGSPLEQQEVFGPVLACLPFEDEAEALAIANGTPYGLVAGVWTNDGGRQIRLARQLQAGQVFINNYGAGGGVELPFGGVKRSGFNREKGFEALLGFTTVKTVAIRHG